MEIRPDITKYQDKSLIIKDQAHSFSNLLTKC